MKKHALILLTVALCGCSHRYKPLECPVPYRFVRRPTMHHVCVLDLDLYRQSVEEWENEH